MDAKDLESGKKLVADHNLQNSKDVEVKFVNPDTRNGDAKIDIENLKSAFTGMGKEELMKYADDPFWVRMRWFLFIAFWLTWIAMLAGAIAIIVFAPKCNAEPKTWWETSPMYKINVRTYADGKLQGINESKLNYIKDLGVSNVILSHVLKSGSDVEANDFIEDFMKIDPIVGIIDEFTALVQGAKDRGLKVLLAFSPVHTNLKHSWFIKSENKEEPYSNYYVWSPPNADSAGNRIPPNNWVSANGGSAWTWSDTRKEYYLHHFSENQPTLNFNNSLVLNSFKEIFSFWMKHGVSGFVLEKMGEVFQNEDLNPKDSEGSGPIVIADSQKITSFETLSAFGLWKNAIANSSGVLIIDGPVKKVDAINLVTQPMTLGLNFSATDLLRIVRSWLNKSSWPVWQWSCGKFPEVKPCSSDEVGDGLQMISMLLPGTLVTSAGEELNLGAFKPILWTNTSTSNGLSVVEQESNPSSSLNTYKKLVEVRHSPAFVLGNYEIEALQNSSLVLTRIKSGNPGYLVAFNPSPENVALNLLELKSVPPEMIVEARTKQAFSTLPLKSKVNSSNVTIPAKAGVLFTFVPLS